MTDQPVIRCAACGGPLAPGAMRCAFCGSQIAQAACAGCLALVPAGASHCPMCGLALEGPVAADARAMRCPGCAGTLAAVEVGKVRLRPCGQCGGIWMDRAAFADLARAHEARDVFLGSGLGAPPAGVGPADPAEVRYRPCPACGKLMNRQNYARISGVIVDACREDGLWFDRDELRKVVVFIEGGGLDRAAQRERETRPAAPIEAGALPAILGSAEAARGSGELPGLVVEALFDAAHYMFRLLP